MVNWSDEWKRLEDAGTPGGEYRVRIHPESPADLHLVYSGTPLRRRLRVGGIGQLGNDDLPRSGAISIDLIDGPEPCLQLSLTDPAFGDLFDVLLDDVATSAANATSADRVPGQVAERVRLWQRFLRKASEGLSREEQRGLFGELWVLLRLSDSIGEAAFEGWTGPTGDAQDFLVGADSLEVKTTAQKLPLSIQITSELQLDDTNVESLHLWVLALDVRSGMGETLPAIISRARSVASASGVRAIFEDLLVQCGYHDVHSDRYTSGYSLREGSIHRVLQDFPRITERDCPVGIGSVRYELQLGAIEKFRVDEAELLNHMKADRG